MSTPDQRVGEPMTVGADDGIDVGSLITRGRDGDPRAVARLITLVESDSPQLRAVMAAAADVAGRADIIGLTGAPGVGKSTLTNNLIEAIRSRGQRVGVLAVDPTSPFTGGALLGDRIRMQDHATDAGVYIRSMATRGHLGGVAVATPQAVRVLEAAGCDVVLVETVGVGQSEVDVAGLADTTLVVLAPGLGDGIQAAKAGILEIADILVVNKADRDGADQLIRDLRGTVRMAEREPGDWRQPIVPTVAVHGDGLDELLEAIGKQRAWLAESGELDRRRHRRVRDEIENLAILGVRAQIRGIHGESRLDTLADRVLLGDLDTYAAADEIVAESTQ